MFTVTGGLDHPEVMTAGRAETPERGSDGSLLCREEIGVSAQMLRADTAGEVFFNRGHGRVHIQTSVIDTVGCNHNVGCEPVTA